MDNQEVVTNVAGAVSIIIAGVILYIQNHRQSKTATEVKETLTQNNGGSSVKDRLDSHDRELKQANARLFRIESILLRQFGEGND